MLRFKMPLLRPASENDRSQERRTADFFICHAHEDGDFAELLKMKVEQSGYTAWMDTEMLQVGKDWRVEIDDGIRNCCSLILIMSPSATKSVYVTYEWAFAWGVGVNIIPIVITPTPLHPRLETLQYLDFTNRSSRPWAKLLEALKENHSRRKLSPGKTPRDHRDAIQGVEK